MSLLLPCDHRWSLSRWGCLIGATLGAAAADAGDDAARVRGPHVRRMTVLWTFRSASSWDAQWPAN
jgi:hypothetical protein